MVLLPKQLPASLAGHESGQGSTTIPARSEAPSDLYAVRSGVHLLRHGRELCRRRERGLVGRALAPIRDQVVIATKFRVGDSASGAEVGRQIRARLEASLTRLGTEYVELYYQHRVSPSVPVEDVAAVMGELIAEGKVGGWGQSQATVEQIRRCTRGHSDHRDPERVLDNGADVRGRRHPSV